MSIWYGDNVADDGELRLCGDIAGKRVLELGVASTSNAITVAAAGAKAIALDPSADRIAGCAPPRRPPRSRSSATTASSPILASPPAARSTWSSPHTRSANVDDLPRLLRQVHRVLKPSAPVRRGHAPSGGGDVRRRRPHGTPGVRRRRRSPSASCTWRSSAPTSTSTRCTSSTPRHVRDALAPSVLVVRARKQGN